MVMSGRRRAFTLVELLMVIIIIGVLAGMMLVGADAMFGRSKATRRLNDRKILEKEYMLAKLNNYDGISGSSADILGKIATNHNGQYTVGTITGICEAGGSYDCVTSDNDRMIKISCSEHEDEGAAEAATVTGPYGLTLSDASSTQASVVTDNGSVRYYRKASADSVFEENGVYYIVYNETSLRNGWNSKNDEWNGALSFSNLASNGNYGVVKLGDDKGSFTNDNIGSSYAMGDVITYNNAKYVCIKQYASSSSSRRPDGPSGSSYWYPLT